VALIDPESTYIRQTPKSNAYHSWATRVLPGGVTANVKHFAPYPLAMDRGEGAHLWDMDGNAYVDYCLGYGPLVLGHGHPSVVAAILAYLDQHGTTLYGTPHPLEAEMGEFLCHLFRADRLRFMASGSEATLHAIRLVHGATGRRKLAKFEGHYHGAVDELLVSFTAPRRRPNKPPRVLPGSRGTARAILRDTVVLPFNDLPATERLLKRHGKDLAGVIVEPVARAYLPARPDFLRGLREITEELDIPLIFDEVMSGFRVAYGGAQHRYGVRPDLTTLGKVIGGGFPCGAVVGRDDILSLASPDTPDGVFHSSTYAGSPIVLAAGLATLRELGKEGVFQGLMDTTARLVGGLREVFADAGVPARVPEAGSTFSVFFTNGEIVDYQSTLDADPERRRRFDFGLLTRGVYVKPAKPFYLSTVHDAHDVDVTLAAAAAAAEPLT
jgi:glutamate-1-semialdehyde 2,1-aminomutase